MAQTASTHSVRFGDGNLNSGNIQDSFNSTTIYKSDKDAEIMRWLSPLELDSRHHDVRTKRFEGVGDWLLGTREFQEWMVDEGEADKAVLFCSGNPGVGKTYLSSLVIDTLCDQEREADLAVAWLYCDYNAQEEQTVVNILGAILKRLVGREVPGDIRRAFQKGRRPLLADLKRMLRIAIASLPQVFICIDALDECLPKSLSEVLRALRDIVQESPKTRIFLTGRPYVGEDIRRYFPKAVAIPISNNQDDIRNYVEMRLDGDDKPEVMSDDLRGDIMKLILDRMSNIFFLVSLKMDAILGESTMRQRKQKLKEATRGNGLSNAYTATLTRLKGRDGDMQGLGLKVLMWVLYSERPLRAEELRHALGVELGSADLDPEGVPALQTLLSSSLGLVTVETSSSTVRLVHLTLQEHLSSDSTLFDSPHSTIAEVCLTYLNSRSLRNLLPTLHPAPSTMPLLGYASFNWGEHARRGMTENVRILALMLLDKFDEHISARLLLSRGQGRCWGPRVSGARGPTGFTGLHGAAFLGIAKIVAAILEMKEWDVNATDCTGSTALTWAVKRGQDEVVRVFLEREDVNPNQANSKYGRTPLSWAARKGHEGIVKMLLEREDINPNQANSEYDRAPLSWAAGKGHEGIIMMLLERKDVNLNQADTKDGQTPLLRAAAKGDEGIVKMLLERDDVNPDQADTEYGQTPLSWAALKGHDGVVKMLLGRGDVNPNQTDTLSGATPLSLAAKCGHEGIVKMLLERKDINPDYVGTKGGRTPLSLAASHGHEGIVKILLEREDVNPNRADTKGGQTPLRRKARNEHEDTLGTFLGLGGVGPDRADTRCSRTPLAWAAANGHEGVGQMLSQWNDVHQPYQTTRIKSLRHRPAANPRNRWEL